MDLLVQPQVVCTIKLWYQKIFIGNFLVGGVYCMALPKALECIIGNIPSTFKCLAPTRTCKVFNGLYLCEKKTI